ncbi:MAG: hypothetical protein QNJ65_05940 [Xenococcaceae cyanobacterium MO_234.B1]|nr:hypothetical protein [Xenococcaceae cyanobacterium MO_234.B1]
MNHEPVNMDNLDASLHKIALDLWVLAEKNQQDSLFLLSLLRSLEEIHRKIRTEMFEPSLPKTRNKLYQLVKDIEEKGGWPYIERMKLKSLLQNLETDLKSGT